MRADYPLTARQRELWVYLSERETCPSFEEMRAALGLESKSGIHRLLGGLEYRGFIRRIPHRARAIEVLNRAEPQTIPAPPSSEVVYLPLYGRINIIELPSKWFNESQAARRHR